MKKVLITGAAGTLGYELLELLVKENKYEITAFDLKSPKSQKKFKKYNKKINIVYGDINDETIVNALVKDHDIIFHLAGIIPPFAEADAKLTKIIDYYGTKNIVEAIKEYNPKAFLFYASTVSIYGNNKNTFSVNDKPNINKEDIYASNKYQAEECIVNNLKKYTIFRYSNIMGTPGEDPIIYNIPKKNTIEFITKEDAANALFMSLNKTRELNKRVFNVSGCEKCQITYANLLQKVLMYYGGSILLLSTTIFSKKNYYINTYKDSKELNEIINYNNDTKEIYFDKLEKQFKGKRLFPKIIAFPYRIYLKKKYK